MYIYILTALLFPRQNHEKMKSLISFRRSSLPADSTGCGQLAHIQSQRAQVCKFQVKDEILDGIYLDPSGHKTKTLQRLFKGDKADGVMNKINK